MPVQGASAETSFVGTSGFIYVICIYLRILVANAIAISDDVYVVWQ